MLITSKTQETLQHKGAHAGIPDDQARAIYNLSGEQGIGSNRHLTHIHTYEHNTQTCTNTHANTDMHAHTHN
jgi:hypothetical protein